MIMFVLIMKRRNIALFVVCIAIVGAFVFFVPVISIGLPSVSSCNSILCTSLNARGYGSISYVWFGIGGTFYSPDHFRVLSTFA